MNLEERWELIAKLEEEKEEREFQEETSSCDTESIKSEEAYQFVVIPVFDETVFDEGADENRKVIEWTI